MTHTTITPNIRTMRTPTEAAALLGVSIRTLERRLAAGQYPVQMVNGRRLIDCGKDATQEAQMLMTAQAMGEEARQAAGMMTTMLQQSLTERSTEVMAARQDAAASRQEAAQAQRVTWRALTAAGLALAITGIMLAWVVAERGTGARLAEALAEAQADKRAAQAQQAALMDFLQWAQAGSDEAAVAVAGHPALP